MHSSVQNWKVWTGTPRMRHPAGKMSHNTPVEDAMSVMNEYVNVYWRGPRLWGDTIGGMKYAVVVVVGCG